MLHKLMWNDNPFDQFEDDFVPRWTCFGKGGGGSQPSAQTVNQGGLPDYAEPFYTRLMSRAEGESNRPYEPYKNQRLADFSQDSLSSFEQIRGLENPEQLGQAEGIYGQSGDYTANTFDTGRAIDPLNGGDAAISQYMNPYINDVLDRNRARANKAYQEAQVARDAGFAQRGAFSNSRRDIASEVARSDLNEQLLDIEARGMADAYNQAGQLYTSDEQRRLQAQIESERAAQAAQGINLQAAQGLAGLGQLEQSMALQRADALGLTGAMQEERNQAGLDLAYSDFVNQRDYGRQNLNWLSGIMHGVPIAAQSETTRYEAPPSSLSQMLGLGLGAYGLYNQFKGGATT